MKRSILTLLTLSAALSLQAQNFTLKGKIQGQGSGYLKLYYPGPSGKQIADSAIVQKNGSFEFKGTAESPRMAYLVAGKAESRRMDDPNMGTFFIEPGNLSMTVTSGDVKNLKLKGSKTQDELAELNLRKKAQTEQILIMSAAYDKANMAYIDARKAGKPEAELEALKEKATVEKDKMDPLRGEMNKIDMEFIKSHPNSFLTAYLLRYKISSLPLAEAEKLYSNLSETVKQSIYGKEISGEIKKLSGGSPGAKATMFAATDINGQPFNLADYKGNKYVLLDFWASWCVPCRKGNPHLLSLYSKYKDKGLEIVGVSDDDSNEQAWKKAVEQDQIGVWRHVLRGLKRVGNDFDRSGDRSDAYGIHTLPTKILIDKNGMIVGRYGGGGENDEAMDKKLAEIFN